MVPGFYWGKHCRQPNYWVLVEVVHDLLGNDLICYIGSDQDSPASEFIELIPANLHDPDGNPYYNSGDNYVCLYNSGYVL